jgi:D-alanyl-D-alanine carboxypeptidase (penicillin-binding protein 5/6)
MKKIVLLAALIGSTPLMAHAQTVAPVETAAKEAFLIDTSTSSILYSKEGDTRMAPSSMSKMMTIYMVFDAIKTGKLSMDQELLVSEHAWRQEGSRMFVNLGQRVKVEDLIRGVIIQSGNDAAVVLAEGLGGSEDGFATMLNSKAAELKLTNSHFVNATGLPNPEHYSTSHDLALIALAILRDFPQHYHYFSETEFSYNNIKQGNRNPLLYRNMNVDGLKTGHTDEGGYGLTASALRDNRRLVLVLNGMSDMQARADESAKVLDWGFREFGFYPVVKAGQPLAEAKVWLGHARTVPLLAAEDLSLTLPRSARDGLKTSITFDQPVQAPISKGQVLGKLVVTAPGMESKEVSLIAAADVPEVGFFAKVKAKLHFVIKGQRDS